MSGRSGYIHEHDGGYAPHIGIHHLPDIASVRYSASGFCTFDVPGSYASAKIPREYARAVARDLTSE
jgi:hypothetical protein